MADKKLSGILRKRITRGLIQAIILFGVLFGISFLQGTEAGQSAFARAAVFSLLLVFGYSLNQFFNEVYKAKLFRQYYETGTALGIVLGGLGFWQTLASFNEFRLWPERLALITLSGLTGYALSRLAAYRGKREGGLWWGFLGWLEGKPALKFLFGILIGLYLVYLRPYLSIDPNALTVIEWFIFCILVLAILIRVWSGAERQVVNEEPGKGWKKHAPAVGKLTGTGHEAMIRSERQFVSIGEPAALYVLMVILLHDNGISEPDIVRTAEPLMNFKGINQARQSSLILSRRAQKQQKKLRETAAAESFSRIGTMGNLNRSLSRGRNRRKTEWLMKNNGEETPLETLRQNFIKGGDRSGLFTRLIVTLHRSGRYSEHIVSALRNLTDDAGNPVDFAVKKLLTDLRMTAEEEV